MKLKHQAPAPQPGEWLHGIGLRSATWEVDVVPDLLVHKTLTSKGEGWRVFSRWDHDDPEDVPRGCLSWMVARKLEGQLFASRGEALQAIEITCLDPDPAISLEPLPF